MLDYTFIQKCLKKVVFNEITNYNKAKYIGEEINNQFKEVQTLVNNNKLLMAICLLRNLYEEIMYIMATSLENIELDINPYTKAGYFKEIVVDNISEILSDNFEKVIYMRYTLTYQNYHMLLI